MAKRADRILKKMDEEGLGDKKLRRTVEWVKSESSPKMREYEDKLEFGLVALAHNLRKYIAV